MQETVGRARCLACAGWRLPRDLPSASRHTLNSGNKYRPSAGRVSVILELALNLILIRHYLKCSAASVFRLVPDFRVLTLGTAYFGLISWQPDSQYTPPAADSGSGIGDVTAKSR